VRHMAPFGWLPVAQALAYRVLLATASASASASVLAYRVGIVDSATCRNRFPGRRAGRRISIGVIQRRP